LAPVLFMHTARREQVRILAVFAVRRTALQEQRRRELARPIGVRKWDEAADAQRGRADLPVVASGIVNGLHRFYRSNGMAAAFTSAGGLAPRRKSGARGARPSCRC